MHRLSFIFHKIRHTVWQQAAKTQTSDLGTVNKITKKCNCVNASVCASQASHLPVWARHVWLGRQNRRWCDHGKILWFRDVLQHFIGIYKNLSAVDNPVKAIMTEATTIYLWIFQDSMLLLFLTSLRQALLHVATQKFLGGKAGRSHLYVYNSSVKTVWKHFTVQLSKWYYQWCYQVWVDAGSTILRNKSFFDTLGMTDCVWYGNLTSVSWAASSYTGGKVGKGLHWMAGLQYSKGQDEQ